jgi:hypothetical protein
VTPEQQSEAAPPPTTSGGQGGPTEIEALVSHDDEQEGLRETESPARPAASEAALEADSSEEQGQRAWRNSTLSWDHTLNTTAFVKSSQLTYNPTYEMAFSLRPRWYLDDLDEALSLRLRQDLAIELTDTDTRSTNREPVLSDTFIDVVHAKLVELEGIALSGGGRLVLPISTVSRANSVVLGTGLLAGLSREFDVLEGLTLGGDANWTHYFATSNVTSTESQHPCFVLDARAPQVCSQVGGPSTVSDSVLAGLSASLSPLTGLTVDLSFSWWWRFGRDLAEAEVPVTTAPGGSVSIGDMSATHVRSLTWFMAGVGYDFTGWLNGALTYATLTEQLSPDGSRRNPFWNVDSAVSLTATLTLDQLYGELE